MPLFDMDPNTANNLVSFGGAAMQAAGQPGASTAGAMGAGIQGMQAAALQRAQTQDIQSQAQSRNLQNQLLPYQLEFMKYRMKALQDLNNEDNGQSNAPPPNSGGQPWSPTLGGSQNNKPSARPVNNPGNLRPVGQTAGFQQFNTPEDGMQALQSDLTAKINGSPSMNGQQPTLRNIIYTYAPPTENNTAAYLENVSKSTGIAPNQVLTADDIGKLAPAITQQEGNGKQAPQRNIGQGIATSPNLPQNSVNIQTLQGRVDTITKKLNRAELAQLPTKSLEENLKAAQEQLSAAMKTQQEVEAAKPKKEAEKEGENAGESQKTYASITSRIDNAKAIIQKMKNTSKDMPDRGPFDTQVWISKHGNQKLESAVKSFENLNENLFTQELPGVIPPGSKLDIPIVNALQKASKVDPHTSHTARITVLNNLDDLLDKAKQNAENNYGITSGRVISENKTLAPSPQQSITHVYKPGKGIMPIGVQ